MKIAYISSSTIPSRTANSIHVMKMCQAFAKNGYEVVLIGPDKKDDLEPSVKDVYKFYGVDNCFEIIRLSRPPVLGQGSIYGILAGLKARSLRPDLAYFRNTQACFFGVKLGMPVVFESHTPTEDSRPVTEWMFRQILKSSRLKKLVVITHALKKYYQQNYFCDGVEIQVAPDGADPVSERTTPADLLNKGERLQVGYVGHLYKGRGVDIIFEMAKNCDWADFHLVGGTEEDIKYWKIKAKGEGNLIFNGFVSPVEAERLRISFDVLLAPYQHEVSTSGGGNTVNWMSPLKIFEYMSAQKPIIASDLPVLREILEHERNALLCPPDDVHAWAGCLKRLRDEPDLGKRLAAAAYDDFITNYTWQARAEKLVKGI